MTVPGGDSGDKAEQAFNPPPDYAGRYVQQGRPNTVAVAALVTSLIGLLVPVISIAAIVLGAIGISQIKRTRQQGYGMAVAGIVVGVATLVVWLIFALTFRMH